MTEQKDMFEFKNEPIKGFPELRWAGKRPFTGTPYYPAQLKETHGEAAEDGWMNKLYWGDNLQVMSHLLKEYRGKVNLIYIDPPFDSKADYKKTIALRGKKAESDSSNFEEKQYGDIWTNDEYLQFMYERLILCKELLSDTGSIYLHCDWHRVQYLRMILDEIFGIENFENEIVWHYRTGNLTFQHYQRKHDSILFYAKKVNQAYFNQQVIKEYHAQIYGPGTKLSMKGPNDFADNYGDYKISQMDDVWNISSVFTLSDEHNGYPTQKPEALLERIIRASSKPGDIVFDCFMGSGTTQNVAMKLGRRFIGSDINLGAIQLTTKRIIKTISQLPKITDKVEASRDVYKQGISDDEYKARLKLKKCDKPLSEKDKYTGFEVYNVNDYDFFRNELEAKRLIIDAMGMQALPENNLWDAELDGRMVAILGINRIATAAEFSKIINNIDMASWTKRQSENFNKPIEKITFVCMGHDPNLKAMFLEEMQKMGFKVDLEIVDILRDKKDLTFKRDADAKIKITKDKLTVKEFYPMNLLQKLSIESQDVEDWKELVDSIMIDWNYDGVTFSPATTDIPEKNEMVKGEYKIPEDSGTIHVKITDLLSESWEGSFEVENG